MKKFILLLFAVLIFCYLTLSFNSPDFFAYNFCRIVKSSSYNEAIKKVNSTKILENKLEELGINIKNESKSKGFFKNVANFLTDTIKDKASEEFKSIIKKEILKGHDVLQNVSSFNLIKLFITKKIDECSLKKEIISKNEVKFSFYCENTDEKSYVIEKNKNNRWEVVKIPYDPTRDVIEKINAKNINKIIDTGKYLKHILVDKEKTKDEMQEEKSKKVK